MKKYPLDRLLNISLIDGRNKDKLEVLKDFFSEFALIKTRIFIECRYLIMLSQETKLFNPLSEKQEKIIENFYKNFSIYDAQKVKAIEIKINHDVKAVEYYLGNLFTKNKLTYLIPFIHFGLTSYDINIPSYGILLQNFKNKVLLEYLDKIQNNIKSLIEKTKDMLMLARTHGQPALPTTMGKELAVFYQRLKKEIKILKNFEIEGKLTGAVGNFNALSFAAPETDWISLSHKFIKSLGLVPNLVTTQIIPYDNWIYFFDSIRRINSILLDLSQNIWLYISFEYFKQKNIKDEVGSSTMAHKINPITFENAEGNLQLANSLFEFFARKLPLSRLQRDLSDSTIKRDFGLAFGFTLLAWDSLLSGFTRISPNEVKMEKDINEHWEIFAEGVQTYLRKKGLTKAFEILKNETRGRTLSKNEFLQIISNLPISREDKNKLTITDLSEYKGLTKQIIELALLK